MRLAPIASAILAATVLAGCELVNNEDLFLDPSIPTIIRFDADIQPLLDQSCTACHGGVTAEAGLRLDSWDNIVAGSDFGAALIPFAANRSLMLRMIEDSATPHPQEVVADSLPVALSDEDLAVLRQWIDGGARSESGAVPHAGATDLLYVTNRDDATVSVIDRATNQVIRVVDLVAAGFPAGSQPLSVAVEPDGSHWYVALAGADVVAKFDRDNQLVGQADFVAPGPMVVHPEQDLLYVSRETTVTNPPLSIGRIDRGSMAVTEIPVLFPRPHAIALDPSGEQVLVGSYGQNAVTRVSVATDSAAVMVLDGVAHPTTYGMLHSVVSDAGSDASSRMITSAALTNSLLVFDVSDPDSVAFVDALPLNADPTQPVFLPGGTVAYVPSTATNTVARVTIDPLAVERVILGEGISAPTGTSISADGRYVYVANRNPAGPGAYEPRHAFLSGTQTGTVVVIDTTTDTVVRVIEVGTTADGLAG